MSDRQCRWTCQTQWPRRGHKFKSDVCSWSQDFRLCLLKFSINKICLFFWTLSQKHSARECFWARGELSAPAIAKRSISRSEPLFNYISDSSPPFFLLYHLSTPLSLSLPTPSPLNFTPGLTPYFQDNHRFDTHSFPILQSGGLNRNWRFNFWNETQEAFWNQLPFPPAPSWVFFFSFLLGCLLFCPPPVAIFILVCWVQPISRFVWRRGRDGYLKAQSRKGKKKKALQLPHSSLRHLFSMHVPSDQRDSHQTL